MNKRYLPFLDSIRGIAILLVLAYHAFPYLQITGIGWIGVDLFFVLSGFLITRILLTDKEDQLPIGNFFIRRVLRIFPLYFLVISVSIILGSLFHLKDLTLISEYSGWFLSYSVNLLFFLNGGFVPVTFLNHFWSLAVEEHFYLLWPFVVYRLTPKQLLILIVIFVVAVILFNLLYLVNGPWVGVYVFSPTRFMSILIGSLISIIPWVNKNWLNRRRVTMWFLVVGVAWGCFVLMEVLLDGEMHTLRKVETQSSVSVFTLLNAKNLILSSSGFVLFGNAIFFSLAILVIFYFPFLRSLFENRFFRFLGKYSYGIYVFHYPILTFYRPIKDLIALVVDERVVLSLLSSSIVVLLTIAVSYYSFHFFESRFLALKTKFTSTANVNVPANRNG